VTFTVLLNHRNGNAGRNILWKSAERSAGAPRSCKLLTLLERCKSVHKPPPLTDALRCTAACLFRTQ
jgi:hypothetical protein